MGDRSRLRVGRGVLYTPTAAEATTSGAGPWAARIVDVNADGTVDLHVFPPSLSVAAADIAAVAVTPPPTPANATYLQAEATATADSIAELQTLAGTMRTAINELKADINGTRKDSVSLGGGLGEFSLEGRSDL